MRRSNKILISGAVVGIVPVSLFLLDIVNDRNHYVEINSATPIYAECDSAGYKERTDGGQIQAGEAAKVLRICHNKDFRVIKIERSDGTSGWIVDGMGVRLHKK
jgi:hypothetical protein